MCLLGCRFASKDSWLFLALKMLFSRQVGDGERYEMCGAHSKSVRFNAVTKLSSLFFSVPRLFIIPFFIYTFCFLFFTLFLFFLKTPLSFQCLSVSCSSHSPVFSFLLRSIFIHFQTFILFSVFFLLFLSPSLFYLFTFSTTFFSFSSSTFFFL